MCLPRPWKYFPHTRQAYTLRLFPLTEQALARRRDVAAIREISLGPEARPYAERCIVTRTSGPPMQPGSYNLNAQFVQTDDYFMIKHWDEPRGVGGIFYDDHCTQDWEADFSFTRDVGLSFLNAFVPITIKHSKETWTEEDRNWQLIKRGRYTEFNLVYDRGTQFGLQTGHNPEAVLMSLPPIAKWP